MSRVALSRWLPPALVYLVVRLAYTGATGTRPWALDPETFSRWDSGNYADIAVRGYEWATCASQNRPFHGELCSTAAWYPAYPYLGRALAAVTRMGTDHALIVVTHVSFVALLYVVWLGLLGAGAGTDRRNRLRAAGLLVLVGFFPGSFYLLAAFPLALLVLLLAVQVACFLRGRWWAGAAAGALASLCYPITAVLPVVSVIWVLIADRSDTPARHRRWRAGGVGAVVLAGTLAVFALHQVELGDWSASLAEQERFGGTLYNPFLNWAHTVVARNSWIQLDRPVTAGPIAAQTALVTLFVVAGAVEVVRARLRPGPGDEEAGVRAHELALLVYVVALWLFPLASTVETGLYRRVLPLIPGVWLLRRAPLAVVVGLVAAAIGVWWWMAPLFDGGDLI